MDVFTKHERSALMAKIRSKDTKPEIVIRKLLHRLGYRFRIHNKHLPGKPDLSLKKYNTAIFVHGCFWHHHKKCIDGKIPKSNVGYWQTKIEGNIARDKRSQRALRKLGWRVLVIWECELKNLTRIEKRLRSTLHSKDTASSKLNKKR